MITHLQLPFHFKEELLLQDLKSALKFSWTSHFNQRDYDGDWKSIALISSNGDYRNIFAMVNEKNPVAKTELLNHCPYFNEIIEGFQFEITSARLLNLAAGAIVKPHRDYCLGYKDGSFRLHIPIQTNPDVVFTLNGERIAMHPGTAWYIDANFEHSVANYGSEDRVHLVIDGIRNSYTDGVFYSIAKPEDFNYPMMENSIEEQKLIIASLELQGTETATLLALKMKLELNNRLRD